MRGDSGGSSALYLEKQLDQGSAVRLNAPIQSGTRMEVPDRAYTSPIWAVASR